MFGDFKYFILFLLITPFLSCDLKAAEVSKKQSILVMEIKSEKIEKSVMNSLTAVLVKEINGLANISAISKNEVLGMLDAEVTKKAFDCETDACLMEIAGAFGAEKIISGNINKIEESFIINLEILKTARAIVESRVNYTWNGKINDLSDLIKVAAQSLILRKKQQKPSKIVISRAENGAKILIDGKFKGKTPKQIKNIQLGPHKLVLQREGFKDYEAFFIAKNGDITFVEAPMLKVEKKLYQQWWFWLGIGVLGAGIFGVILLSKNDSNTEYLDTLILDNPGKHPKLDEFTQ